MAQPLSSDGATGGPVVSEKRVIITNSRGEKLVGILHQTSSKNLVILCHGFRASKDNTIIPSLAAALTKQGISAFRFDFSGNGESEGEFKYGNYDGEVDDLHSVISYFSQGNYDIAAIVGVSKGGNAVLLYASTYHDVQVVVNISACFALDRGIEERVGKEFMQRLKMGGVVDVKDKEGNVQYQLTKDSLMSLLNVDMRAASVSINNKCRVLTIHGSADEVIPVEDAFEFARLIPNHKLHIIEGANHSYTEHQEELASVLLDFITSQVGDASSVGGE